MGGSGQYDDSKRQPLLPTDRNNSLLKRVTGNAQGPPAGVADAADPHHVDIPWKQELGCLFSVAWPVALATCCRLIMAVTDIAVLGRLQNGTEFLAAAALACVVIDVTIAFPSAAADSLNQLCAQADGANNKMLVGRWLQLGIAITSLMCVPVMITWCFTGRILLLIGFSERISSLANTFALWSLIGALPNELYYCIRQYFQAQRIVKPALYTNVIFVLINLGLNIVLVHGFSIGSWKFDGLGFIGSPIATSVSRTLQPIAFVLYACVWKRLHAPTWPTDGFSPAFTRARVKEFLGQSLPTMIGNAAEQWQAELITLMAASLGVVDVATQTSVFNVFFALHCFAFGIAKATTARVGYHLGCGSSADAKQSSKLSFLMTAAVGTVIGITLVITRDYIGHIYSNDPAVWADTSATAPIIGVGYVGCSLLFSFTASLFGQGRPIIVAIAGRVSTWLISLPLAYLLAFPYKLGLRGLWIGMVVAYLVFTSITGCILWRSDWKQLSIDAMARSETVPSIIQQKQAQSSPLLGFGSPQIGSPRL